MLKNFELLNRFCGRKCEIDFTFSNGTRPLFATYIFHEFDYTLDEEYIRFEDTTETECDTSIELSRITLVKNLDEDIYNDVVAIVTEDFTVSVCLLEEKPIIPRCDRCKKELDNNEQVWFINQMGEYNSSCRDGQNVQVKVCDSCFEGMFGKMIPERVETNYYIE
jgi:hypothetical protein